MKTKAKFIELYGSRFTFDKSDNTPLELIPGEEYEVEIRKPAKNRSLNANKYFWVLVSKIAQVMRTTDTEIHDKILTDSIAFYIKDDGEVEYCVGDYETNKYNLYKTSDKYYIDSKMRVKLTKPTGEDYMKNGKPKIAKIFWRIKGSHEMNTKEMAHLIDNTIEEAKALNIETLTPKEIERLKAEWEKWQAKKN